MSVDPKDIAKFLDTLNFLSAKSEDELGFNDPYVTSEQKQRDRSITKLLAQYVSFYEKKVTHSTICRYIILAPCIFIILGFALLLGHLSVHVLRASSTVHVTDLIAFITAAVSFISLIITLLSIITKYFFPDNDEQYIVSIVQSIQKNDLENKRENAKHGDLLQQPDVDNLLK